MMGRDLAASGTRDRLIVRIAPATPTEIPAVAAVHVEAFQSFFLTSLGPRFLRILYDSILRDPTGVVLAAKDAEGRVIGFAAGVQQADGCFSRLVRRHSVRFAWAVLPKLIRSPQTGLRVLRSLRASGDRGRCDGALLMSIAVAPHCGGQGIGGQLLESFLDRMAQDGVQAACLTTDRDANEGTNAFYQRHGFVLEHQFVTPEGRRMNQYRIELSSLTHDSLRGRVA